MDKKERKRKLKYISNNIGNCFIDDKRTLLNMVASYIDMKDLNEEGTGIRILFSKMDNRLLDIIEEFILISSQKTKLDLDSESESDEDEPPRKKRGDEGEKLPLSFL